MLTNDNRIIFIATDSSRDDPVLLMELCLNKYKRRNPNNCYCRLWLGRVTRLGRVGIYIAFLGGGVSTESGDRWHPRAGAGQSWSAYDLTSRCSKCLEKKKSEIVASEI